MSSLMNWDGSQRGEEDKDNEEKRVPSRAQDASDLAHGSGAGSSSTTNVFGNGARTTPTPTARASDSTLNGALSPSRISKRYSSYSSSIAFGSAYSLKTPVVQGGKGERSDGPQAQTRDGVPQSGDGPSVPQTPATRAPDSSAEVHAASTSINISVNTQPAATGPTSPPERQSPPPSHPSPSRTPLGYMEVDEDGEGSPDVPDATLPKPSTRTGADGEGVEAEMAVDVDDDMSDLKYPSGDSSPAGGSQADIEMQHTPEPARLPSPASRPLLSLNGKPNILPDTPPPPSSRSHSHEALARPTSPTLGIFGSTARSPSPPPRKKEPLFLSPTPSDELSQSSPKAAPPTSSAWRVSSDEEEVEVVEHPVPRVDKGKGRADVKGKGKIDVKGKGKEREWVKAPAIAKKPLIGGKKPGPAPSPAPRPSSSAVEEEVFKEGPPRKKKKVVRRVIESDDDVEGRVVAVTVVKKPRIGASAAAKGKAPATSTSTTSKPKSKLPLAKTKPKPKPTVGPKSKITSSDTISITDSSADDAPAPTPVRRKALRAAQPQEEEEESDDDAPVRRREAVKRPLLEDSDDEDDVPARSKHARAPRSEEEEEEVPPRRKPARALQSEDDSDAPPRRHKHLKRPPPPSSISDDSDAEPPYAPRSKSAHGSRSNPKPKSQADSDIEVVDDSDAYSVVPDGAGNRKMEVLVPRMPEELRALVERERTRKAAATLASSVLASLVDEDEVAGTAGPEAVSKASSSFSKPRPRPVVHKHAEADANKPAVPEASSSKPRPRPVVHKPVSTNKPTSSALKPTVSNASKPTASSSTSKPTPQPMDNSTQMGLAELMNAAWAANAHVESDSESEDDVPLQSLHKSKGKDRAHEKGRSAFVGEQKERGTSGASAPPVVAKKPRIGSSAPSTSTSAMPPRTSTSRMPPPPAPASRMPPPPLPSASAPAPSRRTKAKTGEPNDPPCNACAALGISECVNAPYPSHRKCTRCQELGQICSYAGRGRAGSVVSSRAGSVAPSRAGSVAPGRAGSVARGRESSVAPSRVGSVARGREGSVARGRAMSKAPARASSVVSSRMGSVAPQPKRTKKRPHDGAESAPKKRKTGGYVEEALSAPGRLGSKGHAHANAVAGSSKAKGAQAGPSRNARAGPSKSRQTAGSVISLTDSNEGRDSLFTEDEADHKVNVGDAFEIDYDIPPGAVAITITGSLERAPEGSLQHPRRAQRILSYLDVTKDESSRWTRVYDPKVKEGVLDAKYGDEEDRRGGDGWGGGEGGGGEGGKGDGPGGGSRRGNGKQRDGQGRPDGGKGKGKQRADGRQQGGDSKQARDASGSAPPRTQDASAKRKPGPRPKPRAIALHPGPSTPTPTSHQPGPSSVTNVDVVDAFQPPVIPLTPAGANLNPPEVQLLTAVGLYNAHRSQQSSAFSTPTLADAPVNSDYGYWNAPEAQHSPSGVSFEPHELPYTTTTEDDHSTEHNSFWPDRSPVAHRDYHSDSGAPLSIGSGGFANAFAMPASAFASTELAGSSQPDSDQEVSDALKRDGSADTSETAHSEGRSQTIDPSVLGGPLPFAPTTEEEESPIKSRSPSPRSSEVESDPEVDPPVVQEHSDDDDDDDEFKPGKMQVGPPKRRQTARTPKPTPKAKVITPHKSASSASSKSTGKGIPLDPTGLFKSGSRSIVWPKVGIERRCHQCRRATFRRHAQCKSGKSRGNHICTYLYCEGCLVTRYGDRFLGLSYDKKDKFQCPACNDTCNCTHCTRKRGEAYVGVRTKDDPNAIPTPQPSRTAKSANYGPKSVVSKRKHAEQHDSSASPAPRPLPKRIRLILPKRPKTPTPSEPWVAPKMTYEWPAGVKTELFAPDGYPCGYMWVNEEGQCMTTYTREVVLPGVDADGDLYWNEDDVESSSSSSSEDEEDEDSEYEESPVPPPRPKRVRRVRFYAGARPLPPPTVKKLWFPQSRKFKFSPEEPDFAGQQGAYVGQRPPKVKEGPLSPEVLKFLENYKFSDTDGEDDAEDSAEDNAEDIVGDTHGESAQVTLGDDAPVALAPALAPEPNAHELDDEHGQDSAPENTAALELEPAPEPAPDAQHLDDEDDEDIPHLPSPPRSSSLDPIEPLEVHAPAPVPASNAPAFAAILQSAPADASVSLSPSSIVAEVYATSRKVIAESVSELGTLVDLDYNSDEEKRRSPSPWPNQVLPQPLADKGPSLPAEVNGLPGFTNYLNRYGSSTPGSTTS
ncbi:unnamed protein product [Peniophora sp. CBMAI 1063]|nr:unnamed protein product [Peniophora sp. CBMAI 1063]